MQVEDILQIAPYVTLTGAVVLLASSSVFLRRSLRQALAAVSRDLQHAQTQIGELQQNLSEAAAKIQDAEERTGMLVPPTAPKSRLNLNLRTQVIRMSRRGDRPESIASCLNLPKREVELLLKVHYLAVNGRLPARTPE